MNLSLSRCDEADLPWLDGAVIESVRRVCEALGANDLTIDMIVVDDSYIQAINREFRGVDQSTNVISFSYLDDDLPHEGDDLAGEVYVSYQTLEKEAKVMGVSPRSVFLRVGVHGLLHVLGYDHERDSDAERMGAEERRILSPLLAPEEMEAFF